MEVEYVLYLEGLQFNLWDYKSDVKNVDTVQEQYSELFSGLEFRNPFTTYNSRFDFALLAFNSHLNFPRTCNCF
jgi:hypothetical protein